MNSSPPKEIISLYVCGETIKENWELLKLKVSDKVYIKKIETGAVLFSDDNDFVYLLSEKSISPIAKYLYNGRNIEARVSAKSDVKSGFCYIDITRSLQENIPNTAIQQDIHKCKEETNPFIGFTKWAVEGIATVAGVVLAAPVALAGEVFDSEILKDAGESIYKATSNTGVIVGQGVGGGIEIIDGIISENNSQCEKGFNEIGNALGTTINGVVNGIGSVLKSGCEVAEGIINNDTDQIERGASTLIKAAIIAPFAISVADGLDIIDINGNETPVSSVDNSILGVQAAEAAEVHTQEIPVETDDAVLTENGDLIPDTSIDHIPGVHNGMADSSATDELILLGCREDAYHVPDPDRDPAARNEFLRQHGYSEGPSGYEVHHIVPLYVGGADVPENMVLVSIEEHDIITAEQSHYYRDKF